MAAVYPFTEDDLNEAILRAQYGISYWSDKIMEQRRKGMPCPDIENRVFMLQTTLFILQNFDYTYYSEGDVNINTLTVDQTAYVMELTIKWSGFAPNYFTSFNLIQ